MMLYSSEREYIEEQAGINYDEQQHYQDPKYAEHQQRVLWKDTVNGKLAAAYQAVIDSLNDRDMSGEIRESFDSYVNLLEQFESTQKDKLKRFIETKSWGDDTGRFLIDADDLLSFLNGS